jgi:hypothetical protein
MFKSKRNIIIILLLEKISNYAIRLYFENDFTYPKKKKKKCIQILTSTGGSTGNKFMASELKPNPLKKRCRTEQRNQ